MYAQDAIGKRVRITQDCRDGSPASGAYGIYEGDFPLTAIVSVNGDYQEFDHDAFVAWNSKRENPIPEMTRENPKPGPAFWFANNNPRIRLEDGSTIWGCQCWWTLIDQDDPAIVDLQKAQEDTVEVIIALANAIREAKDNAA